jgi:carboxylesterase
MRSRILLGLATLLSGCSFYSYVSTTGDLGVGNVHDTADLLSAQAAPDDASRSLPVVVAVHGFSATTYEMSTAATYLKSKGCLVSRVLMGAHGTTVEAFKNSTWKDWEGPVAAEYNKVVDMGYTNISFLTASTGGPIVMELYTNPANPLKSKPKRINMVAPLLDYSDKNKIIGLAGILQTLGAFNKQSPNTGSSKGHWYSDWPVTTEVMKGRLRTTISIPDDTRIQIFQSNGDPTVDPLSGTLWVNGIHGGLVSLYMVNSSIHVPIGPDFIDDTGKDTWTDADKALRNRILDQVVASVKS